jgi:hypothetical protein
MTGDVATPAWGPRWEWESGVDAVKEDRRMALRILIH